MNRVFVTTLIFGAFLIVQSAQAGWQIDVSAVGGWRIDGVVQRGGGGLTGGWLYFQGGEAVDGSWRMGFDPASGNVVMQVRTGGVWTNTAQFLAP